MIKAYSTRSYMLQFSCVGSECIDTCCRGWPISASKSSYDNICTLLSDPQDRERLDDLIQINVKEDRNEETYATVKSNKHGACAFLQNDGLCELHSRFGDEALFDICAVFPRRMLRVGDELGLSATISCPEVARLCLLQENSMKEVPFDPEIIPRRLGMSIELNSDDPYMASYAQVQGLLMSLVTMPNATLDVRLCVVLHFAERLDPVFRLGGANFDADRVVAEAQRISQLETLRDLRTRFSYQVISRHENSDVLEEIIQQSLARPGPGGRFEKMIRRALIAYASESKFDTTFTNSAPVAVLPARWIDSYERYRILAMERLGDHYDRILTNFTLNYFYTTPYVNYDSLATWLSNLTLQLVAARFLFVTFVGSLSSEGFLELTDNAPEFENLVVDAFQSTSRRFEHDKLLLPDLRAYLNKRSNSLEEGNESLFSTAIALTLF